MNLQQASDFLASLSLPIVNYFNDLSIPYLNTVLDGFEVQTRSFVTNTLQQGDALKAFDQWTKSGKISRANRLFFRLCRLSMFDFANRWLFQFFICFFNYFFLSICQLQVILIRCTFRWWIRSMCCSCALRIWSSCSAVVCSWHRKPYRLWWCFFRVSRRFAILLCCWLTSLFSCALLQLDDIGPFRLRRHSIVVASQIFSAQH